MIRVSRDYAEFLAVLKQRIRGMRLRVSEAPDYQAQCKRLERLIGALFGTQEARKFTARQVLGRVAGRRYGRLRLETFD